MRPVAALLIALTAIGCATDDPTEGTTCVYPSMNSPYPSCAPTPEPWVAPTLSIGEGLSITSSTTTVKPTTTMPSEGVNVGFAAEPIGLAGHEGSIPSTSTTLDVFWPTVEQWRPMVTIAISHHGGDADDVHRFLRIMQCESAGDPDAKNPNSSASGLMQHLTRFWDDRSQRAGRPGADVFDAEANIWVSAWLALAAPEGGWKHWICK